MAQKSGYTTDNASAYPGKPMSATTASIPSVRVSEQRVIELVTTRAQESLQYNQSLFNRLQSWYDIYRGIQKNGPAKFRNDISIPFTLAMIQSLVSRKVMSLFGQWPPVTFEGFAPEDEPRAKKNAALIGAQLYDSDSLRKACDFFLAEAICGTGIARVGWKSIQRMNRVRRRVSIAPGLDVGVVEEGVATLFDGPDWQVVDRLDYWQQPCVTDIAEGWGIHRYWVDLDELLEDAASDYPYFDPAQVRRLSVLNPQPSSIAEYNLRRMTFRNELDYQARVRERFAKPVEILEMHGPVPDEFAVRGLRHLCVAIGNGQVVLRYREGPLGNGKKPFLKYCSMPDPYSFDGIGKAEVAYGPQRTADRLNNQRLDAIDLVIDPQYVANAQAGINYNHLFSRAGRVITVDGPAGEDMIRALVPDMRGVQIGAEEVGRLFSFMQLGTGETEALLGLGQGQSSRETARGFLGRQENALNRLALETALGGRFAEDLANAFRHLDQLFLTLPHEVKILGSVASVDPVTGMPYPAENHTVDYDDLTPDYRARAVGPTQMVGKGVRQQNMVALLQMMSANPVLLQMVNWANFARELFETFDFRNINELLVSQVPAVNMMAQQGGGQMAGPQPGPPSTSLEQLSPEVLAQMSNRQPTAPLGMMGMVG